MTALQCSIEAAAHGFEHVRSSGGIEEHRLAANGLTLLFLPTRDAPVALLMVTYGVGSRDEAPDVRGGSHMIEHLMFKGTARFNRRDGTSVHQVIGAVGGEANATTWVDHTNFYHLLPSRHWRLAAEIEADRMRGMRLDPTDLEAERDVVLNEHDLYAGSPFERLNQAVWAAVHADHPYGRPVLGRREDIAGFDRAALLAHYDRYYWPDNATVTVIGDLARNEVLATIADVFGAVPAGRRAPNRIDAGPPTGGRFSLALPGAPEQLVFAYRSPTGLSPDSDALSLLALVLAGGRSSRLYRTLVQGGHASDVWAHLWRLRSNGVFQIQASLAEDGDPEQVEHVLRAAIDQVRRGGVEPDELRRARGHARGRLLTSRDGLVPIALQLNEAIAMGDWTFYANAVPRLEAVTVDDLQRVAEHWLGDDRLTVGALTCTAETA
jgi:zinc protease